jgi:cell division protein FtsB
MTFTDDINKLFEDQAAARVSAATAPLKATNAAQTKEITSLKAANTALTAEKAALTTTNATQAATITELRAEIERLKAGGGTEEPPPDDEEPPDEEEPPVPVVDVGTIYWDKARLKRLPRSGANYDRALARARGTWQTPIFWGESPSNNAQGDADVQIGAVMAVTLDDAALYEKTRAHLRLATTKPSNWLLGKARQLAGYSEAAYLIGFAEPGFWTWVHESLTQRYGDGQRWGSLDTILVTGFSFNSNWGFMSLRSIVVASVGLKKYGTPAQQADAEKWLRLAVLQYKRLVGEPGDYSELPELITAENGWGGTTGPGYGINPANSTFVTADGVTRDGSGIIQGDWLRTERSDGQDRDAKYYPPNPVTYHYEGLMALTVLAVILDNLKLVPFNAGNNAIRRAWDALNGRSKNSPAMNTPATGDDELGPYILLAKTGIDYGLKANNEPDKAGYGWGPWYWNPAVAS